MLHCLPGVGRDECQYNGIASTIAGHQQPSSWAGDLFQVDEHRPLDRAAPIVCGVLADLDRGRVTPSPIGEGERDFPLIGRAAIHH